MCSRPVELIAIVGFIVLVAIFAGLSTLAYRAWFDWDRLKAVLDKLNPHRRLFRSSRYWRAQKWAFRTILPAQSLFLLILIGVLIYDCLWSGVVV